MLTFGQNKSTGKFVHIRDVSSGLSSIECSCGSPLVAKKGKVTSHHFAHHTKSNCQGETIYHRLAKEILKEEKRLLLSYPFTTNPESVNFEEAHLEHRYKDFVIDCLMITSSGKKLAVEIKVTHEVGLKKRVMFRKESFSAIEIDLSHLSNMTSEPTRESITTDICDSTKYIEWVFNEKRDAEIQRSIRRLKEKIKDRRVLKMAHQKHIFARHKPWARNRKFQ